MNTKTLMYIGIYGVAAYVVYAISKNNFVSKRQKSIGLINSAKYKGFEDAFLKEWGKATKLKAIEFTYKGKVYFTATGRAKVGASVPPKKSNMPSNPFGDSNIN
ncbi:MAG: hypothetical protein ACOVNU_09115 [Candidatus Kapaibacteriota bacterium]